MNSLQQKKAMQKIILALLAIILLIVSVGGFFFFRFDMWKAWKYRGTRFYTPAEITAIKEDSFSDGEDALVADIKHRLEGGTGVNAILRNFYQDSYIYTIDGRYYFTPINFELKLNKLNNTFFLKDEETGEITYADNSVKTYKGIDVSKYQGNINFAKVKSADIDFAIIRCGFRGYETGAITKDTTFDTYAKSALSNDLEIGAYFYTQAITVEEAIEEADFVIKCLKPYQITYPVCIDVEDAGEPARQDSLTNKELTDVVVAFCDRIREAGYTPMIYSNARYFAGRFEIERIEGIDKWYAQYADYPYIPYELAMWQYTSEAEIPGISSKVDMNICFKEYH